MMTDSEKKELKNMLKSQLNTREPPYISDELKEIEKNWDVNRFMAEFIYKSNSQINFTATELTNDIKLFNKENHTNISKENLLEKGFIRIILGKIRIPHHLWWQAKSIFKSEDIIKKYETSSDFLYLKFLSVLYNKYSYEDSRSFAIKKSVFDSIISRYKQYASNELFNSFINKLSLTNINNEYVFNPFYYQNFFDNNLVASYLWSMLCSNNEIDSDITRVSDWLSKTETWCYPRNFLDNLPKKMRERFINAAIEILSNEEDLFSANTEFEKLKVAIDTYQYSEIIDYQRIKQIASNIDFSNNTFVLWESMESKHLYKDCITQQCRIDFSKLICCLLSTDNIFDFKAQVNKLLDISSSRIYIFFKVISTITNFYPERCIDLFDNTQYGLVFFCALIKKITGKLSQINSDKNLISILIENVITLFLQNNLDKTNKENYAYILLFFVKYCWEPDRRQFIINFKSNNYQKAIGLIKPKLSKLNSNTFLLDIFKENKDTMLIENGNGLNLYWFAYLFLLLSLENYFKETSFIDKIYKTLQDTYEKSFLEKSVLSCYDEYTKIETFEWEKLIQYLYKTNSLSSFDKKISEVFDYVDSSDSDSFAKNKTVADKIRIHLKVLCLSLNHMNPENDEKLIQSLQHSIYEILIKCFSNDSKEKTIDAFSSLYESSISDNNTEIFPLVVSVVNNFPKEKKEIFFGLIQRNKDISILFKTYNLLKSDEDKSYFESLLKTDDFSSQIEKICTIPEFIDISRNVLNSKINSDLADEMINRLERIIEAKQIKGTINDSTFNFYLLQLYNLYRKDRKEDLEKFTITSNIPEPYKAALQQVKSRQKFYIALLEIQSDNYSHAKTILESLQNKRTDSAEYKAYYYYTLYLTRNDNNENNNSKILAKIEELEKTYKNDISESVKECIAYTKLLIYRDNQDYEEEINLYRNLNQVNKQNLQFVKPVIECLLNQNKYIKAYECFTLISKEWKSDVEYKNLEKKITKEQTIQKLTDSYKDILSLADEERFKVLPRKINKYTENSGDYILGELLFVFNEILIKQDVINKLSEQDEDRITDIIQICLASRLSMLGYHCSSQERSGSSSAGKNPGELDLLVEFNYFDIVIEAVVSNGRQKEKLENHIIKSFNYGPSKKYLFNLIYYNGKKDCFNNAWETIKDLIPQIKYPQDYKFEKLSSEDDYNLQENNSLKVVKACHNNNLSFYHIMINLSYAKKDQESITK